MAPAVKPIPDGFRTCTPYMVVKGAAQAIEFYKKAFDAKELMRMPGPGGAVMHAEIQIGNSVLMMCDEMDCGGGVKTRSPLDLGGTPMSIHLYVEKCDAAFDKAVKAGCKVQMPMTDMFWGDRFGKVVDPFGHEWSIATHMEDLTPEEIGKRMEKDMQAMSAGK